jgi:hypothetical protein
MDVTKLQEKITYLEGKANYFANEYCNRSLAYKKLEQENKRLRGQLEDYQRKRKHNQTNERPGREPEKPTFRSY